MSALLIGVIAGLRSMTAPAAVTWIAHAGQLDLANTWAAFLGWASTRWIFTLLALGELVADKLPSTPSRKSALPFGGRIVTGALSGAALCAAFGTTLSGLLAGAVGAVIGTLGGHAFRARLAAAIGSDLPAALVEDAIAVGGAFAISALLR
jgi:uncharacterized membrane protein